MFLLILFSFISVAYTQDVYWKPVSPVQGGQVTIFYNLEARGILPISTNPCYIHVGYNGWSNTTDFAMTKTNDGLWEYEMAIPSEARIIDFVFTDLQGNWDNNGGVGVDWHFNVFSEGLSVVVVSPIVETRFGHPMRSPYFASENEIVEIALTTVSTAPTDSLFLFVDNVAVAQVNTDTLKYDFDTSVLTNNEYNLIGIAQDNNGVRDTTNFAIIAQPEPFNVTPNSHIKPGINYSDTGRHTLALFAPYKDFVYVIGDFNDWKVDNNYLMRKYEVSLDSILWLKELGLGSENSSFQYLIDGEIRIADPYADLILDQWNDQNIPSATYPNLKEYPHNKTTEAVSLIDENSSDYTWQCSADFVKPKQKNLVIYELLIRDFIANHDYQTLIDTLDYLENLGINAIELMPINEFEGNSSWGYNPSFYFAPDKYYGTKNDLKAFIDECHRRGIAVIQDIVLNHSYSKSPLVRMYWDVTNNRPAANSPWYNTKSPNAVYSWGYDFNHESEHTKYFVDRVLRYWIEQYKIDGFRLDFTKGFTQKKGEGTPYDASRIAILKRIGDTVWDYSPDSYLILEHFADNVEEKELADYGFMLWGNTNHNYNEATMGYNSDSKSDFSWGFYKQRGWTQPNLVTFMESHDEERLMYKNLTFGNSAGLYNVTNLSTALDRQKLAAAFFFTLPGPKMIWQFGELGYDFSIDHNGRIGEKPIRWDYFQDSDRRELYDMYSQLIKMRNRNEVFRSPETSVDLALNNANGLKRIGLSHSSMSAIIIGNFGVTTQSINPNFYYSALWYDDINAVECNVTDTQALIELAPGEFRIFTNKHLLSVEDEDSVDNGIPDQFSLAQNFPNPFNPVTTIQYVVPDGQNAPTSLKIYDILGSEVAELVNEVQSPGEYELTFNTNNSSVKLSNGVYFYRLSIGNKTLTKKMLLLK